MKTNITIWRLVLLLLAVHSSALLCCGQGLLTGLGSRAAGLAQAGVVLPDPGSGDDPMAAWYNPAAVAKTNGFGLAAGYTQLWMLEDLHTAYYGLVLPLQGRQTDQSGMPFDQKGKKTGGQQSAIGLHGGLISQPGYREQQTALTYARSFGPRLWVGLQFHWIRINLFEYGTRDMATAAAGIQCQPLPDWTFGLALFNPFRVPLAPRRDGEPEVEWPVKLAIGSAYAFSPSLHLLLQSDKDLFTPLRFRTALEYQPVAPLAIRIGLASAPFRQYGGLGYHFQAFQLDFALEQQPLLGWSVHAGVSWVPGSVRKKEVQVPVP